MREMCKLKKAVSKQVIPGCPQGSSEQAWACPALGTGKGVRRRTGIFGHRSRYSPRGTYIPREQPPLGSSWLEREGGDRDLPGPGSKSRKRAVLGAEFPEGKT